MTKLLIFVLILLIAVGSAILFLGNDNSPKSGKPSTNPQISVPENNSEEAVAIVATNLEVPWSIAFLPDGSMLVTERPGLVKHVSQDGKVREIARVSVQNPGEGGLHGVVLDPNFGENKNVYLYYTYRAQGDRTLNRVVRFRLEDNKLIEEKIIVDEIPGAPFHDGGRIKFGPDGFLYITTGDAQDPSRAQDRDSLAGKILRVTRDGDPAPGNPFGTRIYSYGHRNPQGITWDSQGKLWETEHGSSATDELNLIDPGKNYGWPEIRGDQTRAGMVSPIIQSGSQTWAPGGAAYLNGSIFFAGLRGSALYEYKISENRIVEHFKGEFGRIRDVILGPDNMLYITTSNRDGRGKVREGDDKIIRVNPERLASR